MSELVLHPRAAAGDRLRLWVGAFGYAGAPRLAWRLDGRAIEPAALRAMRGARPADMLEGSPPRAYTGLYEFDALEPGSFHRVDVAAADGAAASLEARTLPAEVPAAVDGSFNVLLVSCFHRAEDRDGLAGSLVASLPAPHRPHLTLLLGDQVYLDLPTLSNFRSDLRWLARRFEEDYADNWRGPEGYARLLRAAPVASTPDDHEYWNDFPRVQRHIPPTWSAGGRDAWRRAAAAMFEAFQGRAPGEPPALELDVRPLSFFVMDARSDRQADASRALSPATLAQLRGWTARLAAEGLFGVIAAGQSLLTPPAGLAATDLEIADHGDYPAIVDAMRGVFDAGLPLLLLTGDVHFGRVTRAIDIRTGRPLLHEVISSPTSLVTTIGLDQIRTLGAAIGGLFGRREPWPRHGSAKDPPPHFAARLLGPRLPTSCLHRHRGNMVALLSFRRVGSGVEGAVRYWSIDRRGGPIRPDPVEEPLILSRA